MSSWCILGAYLTRYDISVKLRICIRNVLFRDLSISVKYLTQNRPNGKICTKYILHEHLWWYMIQILPLFYSKYGVSIFLYTAIGHIYTLYMTRRWIIHSYLIRYGWCQQNLKYALEMPCIRKWIHFKDMTLSDIWSQYLTHQDLPEN